MTSGLWAQHASTAPNRWCTLNNVTSSRLLCVLATLFVTIFVTLRNLSGRNTLLWTPPTLENRVPCIHYHTTNRHMSLSHVTFHSTFLLMLKLFIPFFFKGMARPMALSRHGSWKNSLFFIGVWPSHASRMPFLTKFDWVKHMCWKGFYARVGEGNWRGRWRLV